MLLDERPVLWSACIFKCAVPLSTSSHYLACWLCKPAPVYLLVPEVWTQYKLQELIYAHLHFMANMLLRRSFDPQMGTTGRVLWAAAPELLHVGAVTLTAAVMLGVTGNTLFGFRAKAVSSLACRNLAYILALMPIDETAFTAIVFIILNILQAYPVT